MKQLLSFLVVVAAFSGKAQLFTSDISDENIPITWLGLDFTKAKMIEDAEHPLDEVLLANSFERWNEQIVASRKRYPLAKSFGRKQIHKNVKMLNERNKAILPTELITIENHLLYIDDIRESFSRYRLGDIVPGLAFSYMVETIDAVRREFSGYMVAIDVEETRIIKTYYIKVRFGYELKDEELVKPFSRVLAEFWETINME